MLSHFFVICPPSLPLILMSLISLHPSQFYHRTSLNYPVYTIISPLLPHSPPNHLTLQVSRQRPLPTESGRSVLSRLRMATETPLRTRLLPKLKPHLRKSLLPAALPKPPPLVRLRKKSSSGAKTRSAAPPQRRMRPTRGPNFRRTRAAQSRLQRKSNWGRSVIAVTRRTVPTRAPRFEGIELLTIHFKWRGRALES